MKQKSDKKEKRETKSKGDQANKNNKEKRKANKKGKFIEDKRGGNIFETQHVTLMLSIATLVGEALVLALVLLFIMRKKQENKSKKAGKRQNQTWQNIDAFFCKYGLWIALGISLLAVVGSLYYSEIAWYAPCKLCWYQRIMMYPLPLLYAVSLWKKDKTIQWYTVPLAALGATIAAYHYLLQITDTSTICSPDGISCVAKVFFTFGHISIPFMALIAFLLIIMLTILGCTPTEKEKKK